MVGTRAQVLRRGLIGAAALAVGGKLAPAGRGAPAPDGDLAYLRLLAAAELLKADFEKTALASKRLRTRSRTLVRRLEADDTVHYRALAALTAQEGQQPPTAGDIDYSYPARAFSDDASMLELAVELTRLTLGAYLGAIESLQTPALRLPCGQIAANEAQQLSALEGAIGHAAIGRPFATALSIEVVSVQLDRFES